jgi:hydrogenase maturation protein HypF
VSLPAAIATGVPLAAQHEVDLRPTVRAAVSALLAGRPAAEVSARFHRTVVDATMEVTERILDATGVRRVVLSGGSFQNLRLLASTRRRLEAEGFRVLEHRRIPPNDGGISYGQAAVAAAR